MKQLSGFFLFAYTILMGFVGVEFLNELIDSASSPDDCDESRRRRRPMI